MHHYSEIAPFLKQVEKPTLVLRVDRAKKNLARMINKAAANHVFFRPHFKTHQSAGIGQWFREFGVKAITVSSLDMAEYFARHGWTDITLAFPVNLRQMAGLNELAATIKLNLLVESFETVVALNDHLTSPVEVWIKIDIGYGRTGVPWEHPDQVIALGRAIVNSPLLKLAGLLTHAGHTYQAGSVEEIQTITDQSILRLTALKNSLAQAGLGPVCLSVGDTPGCSIAKTFTGVDEIRPGVFIFYDLMQYSLGACTETDLALAVACPVVAKHPRRGVLVIYGGAVHLSKDHLLLENGSKCFGRVAWPQADGWGPLLPDAVVTSISQEHGLVKVPPEVMDKIRIGEVLMVIPVHACLSADLLKRYLTVEGEWMEMNRG